MVLGHCPRQLHFEGIFSDFRNTKFNGKLIGCFILGDLNCPHFSFGSRTSNEFGNKLLQSLNHEDLIHLDLNSPTYYSNSSGEANTLDLVIADAVGSRLVESCYVDGDIGSDHLPVVTTLSFKSKPMWKVKTNMTNWAKEADKMLENFVMSDDIDKNIVAINRIFAEAKEKCTNTNTHKRRKANTRNAFWIWKLITFPRCLREQP